MDTHDQTASSYHVVAIRERDEEYGGQVVDKHDDEILPTTKESKMTGTYKDQHK